MNKRWSSGLGLWLLLAVMLLAGCAAGGTYQAAGSAGASINTVPPALQGTAPALREWYSAPYFNPYEMP
jgi:hypothetical protein